MKSNRENILVLTYWSYQDALIQTYTLPYVRMIKSKIRSNGKIYLMTLEKPHLTTRVERSGIRNLLRDEGIEWISFRYIPFGFMAIMNSLFLIVRLWWLIGQQNINTIHSWCTPAGGLGWVLSKLTGKQLILDSYEPHAEPMVEAGQWDENSLAFRLLFWLERKQSRSADTVIACVDSMRTYANSRYNASFKYFYVKPACVDLNLFHPEKSKNPLLVAKYGLERKMVYVYAGKFGGSYLTDEVFLLLKKAQDFYQDRFAVVLLNNHPKEFIVKKALEAGVNIDCIIHEFIPHSQVPEYMGLGDVGLVPFVPVSSKRYGSPIKTGEYLAMGIPVLITKDISDDSEMIEEFGIGSVWKSFDDASIVDMIKKLDVKMKDPEIKKKARIIAEQTKTFDLAERVYSEIYSN